MLLWKRPATPSAFETKAKPLRKHVQVAIDEETAPDFKEIWQSHRHVFQTLQHGKCAYCEAHAASTSFGHLEHFRPKSRVSELPKDRRHWGREAPGTSKVEGRRLDRISPTGYHWLAYEWTNYLYACERCNTGWKRDLFPVADDPRQLPPRQNVKERSLLLDPFGDDDPKRHLHFTRLGTIESLDRSPTGRQTIDTLGLDRPSLDESRREKARMTHRVVARVKQNPSDIEALRDLHIYGDARHIHAGMVRCIVYQELELTWDELEAAIQD